MDRQHYDRLRAEVLALRRHVAQLFSSSATAAHAISHQNVGSDEISVAGLSGLLADSQTPLAHAPSHAALGSDEVAVTGLGGFPGGTTTYLRADGSFATPPGTGTVTTTGSPASGNLTAFSGATSITNGDLSGDVTTAGTLVATIANDAVSNAKAANMAEGTIKGRALGAGTGDPTDLTAAQVKAIAAPQLEATVGITIDGGGSVITTGVKGFVQVPFGMTITAARLFADVSGSIVVDVWKDTYANFPPVDADSITASAPPTLSGAQKSEDVTLTGWTTAVTAGAILGFNVDSAATVTRVTLQLIGTRT